MNLLTEPMVGLGGALLPVVAGLLLEELTLGGLVRLVVAPRPGAGRRGPPGDESAVPEATGAEHNRAAYKREQGEGR